MRHGNLNFRNLIELSSKNLVHYLPKLNANTMSYEAGLIGKQNKLSSTIDMSKRSNDTFEVIYI